MKRVALLLLATSGQSLGQNGGSEFLSWYNGWGIHTVWGAGQISGSYKGAHVLCGDTRIPVRAIHDTHETDGRPLAQEQTAEHARSVNIALLHALEALGDKCQFQQASADEG